jgi:DNA-binding transcriptional MocR family regulator
MRRLEWIADTYLSVSTQVQLNAARLLDVGASVRHQIQQRTAHNLATLERVSRDCPSLTVLAPHGGWSVVIRLPATQSEEAWVLQLVEAGVLVHPGHFYDFDREAFLVLSLLPEATGFETAVRCLCACVNEVG